MSCMIDEIEVEIEATVPVDETGQPDMEMGLAGYSVKDVEPYHCTNCDSYFDSYEDAKAHVDEQS